MSTIEPIKSGFCLRVLEGSHHEALHPLTRSVISMGRATAETPYSSSYITFPEATVSRLHVVLTWEPGASAYMIHHRSQTNPTLLNGKQLTRSELLEEGDVLALGRLVLSLEESKTSNPAISLPQQDEVFTLNVRNKGDKSERVYCAPVQKNRLVIRCSPGRTTAAIAAEETGDLAQLIALPAECESELSFEFNSGKDSARVEIAETGAGGPKTLRRSVLSFGSLEVPLRVGTPLILTKNELLTHQSFQIWLAAGSDSKPPHSTIDGSPTSTPPGADATPQEKGGLLEFLNGPWKGARLSLPFKGSQTFLLGPKSTSFGHPFPHTNVPTCRITLQDGNGQIRVNEVRDDQFVDVNGELLFTGESLPLFSGSRVLLGDAEFYWQVPKLHSEYTSFAVQEGQDTHPISKAEVKLGTAAHCEVKINSKSVAPVVGVLKYQNHQFSYCHQNIAMSVRVDGNELSSGLECEVREGSVLELAPGVEIKLIRHEANHC